MEAQMARSIRNLVDRFVIAAIRAAISREPVNNRLAGCHPAPQILSAIMCTPPGAWAVVNFINAQP
jgi:hypothetical protein